METFWVILLSSSAYTFGCSDIIPPDGSWIKRHGDTVIIICNASRQMRTLACINDKWVGELGNCLDDGMRNKLIITCIGMVTLIISVSVIAYGYIRIRALYIRTKATARRASRMKKICICEPRFRIAALDAGNPNVVLSQEIPISYNAPDVTPSIANVFSHEQTNYCTTNGPIVLERKKKQTEVYSEVMPINALPTRTNAFEPGPTFYPLSSNGSYLDHAENFSREKPTRTQQKNSISGYFQPSKLKQYFVDIGDYASIQPPPIWQPYADANSGAYASVANRSKPLSQVHDYLDLANHPTLPHSRSHAIDSRYRNLFPKKSRYPSQGHEYLDLNDCGPNRPSLRRRHSYPTSGC